MIKIFLRSACVGIGMVAAVAVLGLYIGLPLAMHFLPASFPAPPGEGEVGWDLVVMARNAPPTVLLFPLFVFAVSFVFTFRYFSRRLSRTERPNPD